jgi:6-phosphogluconolactonase
MSARWEVAADRAALAQNAAQWFCDLATASDKAFAVALSGGTTPRGLYETLADAPYRDRMPWPRIHWFWSDERFVPHDDPRSNYRMAHEALLARVPIPPANIHPISTAVLSPEEAAARYEAELKSFHGAATPDPARPLFDIMLLGLGVDGHIASLFPKSAALDERQRWAVAVPHLTDEMRITLTYPILESSRHTAFLVAGAEKRTILKRVRRGDGDLPASRLKPQGDAIWFADRAAAGP